jgi:hypothetical protein
VFGLTGVKDGEVRNEGRTISWGRGVRLLGMIHDVGMEMVMEMVVGRIILQGGVRPKVTPLLVE